MAVGKGSSSSKHIKVFASKRVNDKRSHTEMLLNAKGARLFREIQHEQLQSKIEGAFICSMDIHRLTFPSAMDNEEQQAFESARDIPDINNDNDNDSMLNIGDILDGSMCIDLSHAGGEFQQILEEGLLADHW
jgi:hypothetical protein